MLFLFVCSSLENFQGSLRLARRQIPFNSCFCVFDILFLSAATPASNLTSSLKPRQDAQKHIKRSSAVSKHAVAKFQALCHTKAAEAGTREGSCAAAVPHCPQRRGWPGTHTTPAPGCKPCGEQGGLTTGPGGTDTGPGPGPGPGPAPGGAAAASGHTCAAAAAAP